MPLSRWDAAEGGTTATIAILSRAPGSGTTLTVGAVGDSSALLGGTIAEEEGEEGGGEVTFEELMEEHSATNAKEYERVLNSGPRGKMSMPSPTEPAESAPPRATMPPAR